VVEVSDAEIVRLAGCLGLAEDAFRECYTRRLRKGRIALRDASHGDCAFLVGAESERGCRVHAARPDQCRSYPFWPSILHTRAHWREEGDRCPGIGSGAWHDEAQIEQALSRSAKEG